MRPRITFAVLALIALVGGGCMGSNSPGRQLEQSEIADVRLLSLGTRLPPSASNVWLAERQFVDADQALRFDAEIEEARSFAREILGRDLVAGENPHMAGHGPDRKWWLRDYPAGAEGGERDDTERRLLIRVILMPMGEDARIWVQTAQG